MPTAAKTWWPLAANAAILGLAYGPLLATFFTNLWERPQYQYFPFVLGAFGWLLWRSCSQSQPRESPRSPADRGLMVGLMITAWVLLALAYVASSPWLAIVSAIVLVASQFVRISSGWRVEYLWGIWAMLLLLVPLPLNRDQLLVSKLQHYSSRLSSFFLDWLGVHHLMDGNALILPDKEFFVDEACSGIVSVMSVIACAVIYGVWRNRSPLHVILLAVAGVAWATLMNVGRITTIAVAFAWWGIDLSSGTPHEILGLVVFMITFLALVSTDYLLIGLLAPIVHRGDEAAEPIHYGARLVAGWDRLLAWGAPRTVAEPSRAAGSVKRYELWSRLALGLVPLLAFGTLAAAQLATPLIAASPRPAASQCIERALALDTGAVPEVIGNLRKEDFELQERERDSILGQYSRVYRFRSDVGKDLLLSFDFPFEPSGHDLTVCYKAVGWEQVEPNDVREAPGAENWQYIESRFSKPDGHQGLLVFSAFNEFGEVILPPTRTFFSDLWASLLKSYQSKQTTRTFQIQVWTTANGPVSEEQAAEARELLLAARDRFRQRVAGEGDAGGTTDSSAD